MRIPLQEGDPDGRGLRVRLERLSLDGQVSGQDPRNPDLLSQIRSSPDAREPVQALTARYHSSIS